MKVLLLIFIIRFLGRTSGSVSSKAWKKDVNNTEKMCSDVYDFTKKNLFRNLKMPGQTLEWFQVGNEITNGLLGIYSNRDKGRIFLMSSGEIKKKSTEANKYLKAGIKAVREYTPQALVALHLETPNVWKYKTIMNTWKRDNVDYDVLGSSYYPFLVHCSKSKYAKDIERCADTGRFLWKDVCSI